MIEKSHFSLTSLCSRANLLRKHCLASQPNRPAGFRLIVGLIVVRQNEIPVGALT